MTAKRTIDNDPLYSPAERAIYHATLKASLLRAAAIRVDRAMLASTHLQAIANGECK